MTEDEIKCIACIALRGPPRNRSWSGRFRRYIGRHAGSVVSAGLVSCAVLVVGLIKGIWGMPGRQSRVEVQVTALAGAVDSLRKSTTGVVAVLCLKLSDEEFEAAKNLCGEAFTLNRVLTRSRAGVQP